MRRLLKSLAKGVTPPFVWNSVKSVVPLIRSTTGRNSRPTGSLEAGQQDAAWYDQAFLREKEYHRHYTGSPHYFLWCVLVDRITRAGIRSVLDVGCGPGQLARFLRDKGVKQYCGVDFSQERIKWARSICPDFQFVLADVLETDLFEKFEYDAVLCTEFLEHVERDVEILRRIRAGARFYGTVPNFPFTSHVRHFAGCDEIYDRYGGVFSDLQILPLLADAKGKQFYVLEGVRC